MYEIKRTIKITEQLKLGSEVLDIVIVPEDIAREYNRAVAGVQKAQQAINAAQGKKDAATTTAAVDQFGDAIVTLMDVLLGKENTAKILTFYDGNRIEMSSWITPFLINVIKPGIEKAAAEMRQKVRDGYRKAGRRRLFA